MPVAFSSDVVGAVPTSSSHSSTPDFPEEDPPKEALDKWVDAWDAYAATNGYAPMLQGRDPPSVIQFTERDLSLIPALPSEAGASAVAAREALRAQIIHDNAIKRKHHKTPKKSHKAGRAAPFTGARSSSSSDGHSHMLSSSWEHLKGIKEAASSAASSATVS
ncbi:hypothetical protein AB1Y20_006828 [Prymnesium parvum]|uniref:SAM domain-containing protein n=1 Tax=Prymnesium parvum TaxID=97485 RepID=A0AB34J0Z2_PRYPA